MSTPTDLFGWDLLFKTVESNITRESEIIIALAHWFLIRHGSFRCLGVGDDKTLADDEEGTELLPEGWNESGDSFALRYTFDKKLYILLGAKTEDTLVLNVLDVHSRNVSNVALNLMNTVKCLKGPLNTMIPGVSELLYRFKLELLEPVFSGTKKEVTTQTQQESSSSARPQNANAVHFHPIHDLLLMNPNPINPLHDVGRGDLDPLGRGGGMLFNPMQRFRPPQPAGDILIHRMRVPPGARFDPFGPPEEGRVGRANPNPDHFRPPNNFDDHMFM